MLRCDCGFIAKSKGGLSSHRRQKHPDGGGSNRRALERTLVQLRRNDHLGDADSALIQLARSLADEVDKGGVTAQLWRTYREVLRDLMGPDDGDGGSTPEEELEGIRRAAAMGYQTET